MAKSPATRRGRETTSFGIGRVRGYLRGRVWYPCYHEHGRRHQPRIGPERGQTRQMAAEINAQLEIGTPFTPTGSLYHDLAADRYSADDSTGSPTVHFAGSSASRITSRYSVSRSIGSRPVSSIR